MDGVIFEIVSHQYPAIVGADMSAVVDTFYPYRETKFAGVDLSFQFHQYPAIVGVDVAIVATPFSFFSETRFKAVDVGKLMYYLYLTKIEGTAIGAEGITDIRLLNKRSGAYLDRAISNDGAYKFMGMSPTEAYLVYAIDWGKDANVIMRQAIVEECPDCTGFPSPFR